jgi:hypothetical protein
MSDVKMAFPFPTHEQLAKMAEEGRQRRIAAMAEAGDKFCPLDLGDWMRLCAEAQVPTVAAIEIASGPTIDIWRFDEDTGNPDVPKFWAQVKAAKALLRTGWMFRWSCGSMGEVKYRLSAGEWECHPDFTDIYVDDIRAFDIIGDYPKPNISVWARPWTRFDVVQSYPVEYRVFVRDDQVVGVSNYYPQRPLPDAPWTKEDVGLATYWAMALVAAQKRQTHLPQVERRLDLSRNQFTADFARLPSGALVFLEGGPPHTPHWGAHMCCFKPGEISGLALEDRNALVEAT